MIIAILLSLAISFLVFKFSKQIMGITLIFLGGIGISIIVAFFDLQLATKIFGYSLLLGILMWILIGISGFISAIILVPLMAIWGGLKMFFDNIFKSS